MPSTLDRSILEIALAALELHRTQLDRMIESARRQVTGKSSVRASTKKRAPRARKRPISEEARQRMAEGQRKRWAASRKQPAKAAKSVPASRKRVMSADARERIAAAQRKRWAAVRKAKPA